MRDHVGAFAVTSGIGLKKLCDQFRAKQDDYNAIMAEAIADRLAEAFAECLHKRVRRSGAMVARRSLSNDGFDSRRNIAESDRLRVTRPAPITPRKARSGVCSMWRPTLAC